jgi:hypothetical protein
VQSDPHAFSRKVKDYCKSPFANIVTQWATSPALSVFAKPVRCYICGLQSKSYQAHCVHSFSKHGIKSSLRKYVPLTHCLVCLREFHTRENCLNHIRYRSKVCRSNLLMRGPSLSTEEANRLDELSKSDNVRLYAQGRRRHHVVDPCALLSGPLLPVLLAEGQYSALHPLGIGHSYI